MFLNTLTKHGHTEEQQHRSLLLEVGSNKSSRDYYHLLCFGSFWSKARARVSRDGFTYKKILAEKYDGVSWAPLPGLSPSLSLSLCVVTSPPQQNKKARDWTYWGKETELGSRSERDWETGGSEGEVKRRKKTTWQTSLRVSLLLSDLPPLRSSPSHPSLLSACASVGCKSFPSLPPIALKWILRTSCRQLLRFLWVENGSGSVSIWVQPHSIVSSSLLFLRISLPCTETTPGFYLSLSALLG